MPALLFRLGAVLGGIALLFLLRGRLGRAIVQGLERVIAICADLIRKGLHPEELVERGMESPTPPADTKPTNAKQESTGSEVFMILTRLLALFLSLDVLLAVYILDSSRVPLVVFDSASGSSLVNLPLNIPTVMGLLSWALATLQGSFLLEVLGVIPTSAEFLPPWWRRTRSARIFFRVVVTISNLLLVAYISLLGLVASLKLQHVSWPMGSVLVSELQIILAHITALFSLWLLVIGAGALFSFVCLIVRLVCAIAHTLLNAWVQPAKPVKQAALVPAIEWAGPGAEPGWAEGGQYEKPVESSRESREIEVIPVKTELAPLKTTVIAAGEFGRRFLPDVLEAVTSFHGEGSVRVAGYCPTGRTPDRSLEDAIKEARARSISITPRELTIDRYRPGDTTASVERLLDRQFFKIQEHTPKVAGEELILVGLDWELIPAVRNPLIRLAATLRRHLVVPVVEIPGIHLGRSEVQTALQTLVELREQGVIPTTILTDRQGPLTQRVVREKLGRLLGRTLAGMVVAHQHYEENPTGAQMLAEMGDQWPFVSMAVGSVGLASGPSLSLLDPGRWVGRGKVGRGDVEQTRHSLEFTAEQLLQEESARLFPMPLDAERALYAEVCIPFPQDQRYLDICEGLERWTAENTPSARPLFIAGPGEPDDSIESSYFGQWSWFYGFALDELLNSIPTTAAESDPRRNGPSGRTRRQEKAEATRESATQTSSGYRRRTPLRSRPA